MKEIMEKKDFINRLTELRMQKGVSARDMSLSLGQSPGYINNIENGVNLPSMTTFFYICQFLDVTPKEFFDLEDKNPIRSKELITAIEKLDDDRLRLLIRVAKEFSD